MHYSGPEGLCIIYTCTICSPHQSYKQKSFLMNQHFWVKNKEIICFWIKCGDWVGGYVPWDKCTEIAEGASALLSAWKYNNVPFLSNNARHHTADSPTDQINYLGEKVSLPLLFLLLTLPTAHWFGHLVPSLPAVSTLFSSSDFTFWTPISSLLFIVSSTVFILQAISYLSIFPPTLLPLINRTVSRNKSEPHSPCVKTLVILASVCRSLHLIPLKPSSVILPRPLLSAQTFLILSVHCSPSLNSYPYSKHKTTQCILWGVCLEICVFLKFCTSCNPIKQHKTMPLSYTNLCLQAQNLVLI